MKTSLLPRDVLKIAEGANSRISRYRASMIKSKYLAEKRKIITSAKKAWKIGALEERMKKAQDALAHARDALYAAEDAMETSIQENLEALDRKQERDLGEEMLRSTRTSMKLIGASLPPDIRQMLLIEDTTKKITADVIAEEE